MERPFVGPVLALMLGMVLSRELTLPPLAGLALGWVGLLLWGTQACTRLANVRVRLGRHVVVADLQQLLLLHQAQLHLPLRGGGLPGARCDEHLQEKK